jgi:aminoglycoside phosphotransferase (APT) family kinase protein
MTKPEMLRKIRKEFPDLKWQKSVLNVEGWDHYMILLDDKYVFRFPRTEEYAEKLKTEIGLLDYLKDKIKIKIPVFRFIAKDKSFVGYDFVEGIQLRKNIFQILSPTIKKQVAKQMADFLTALHKTPLAIAKKFVIDIETSKQQYASTLRAVKEKILPRVLKNEQKMILDFLDEYKKYLNFPNKVLVHADLYTSHILLALDKKSLAGIIDFADRTIDDPALDFCELWYYGHEFVLDIYKDYKGPKDPQFIMRSYIYYLRSPLWFMDEPGAFADGYRLFKEIYRVK